LLPIHLVGVENIRKQKLIGSILEFEFSEGDDFTTVRLSQDYKTISIFGLGDASLKIALLIQKNCPQPIVTIDSDYSFELILDQIDSVKKLRQKILDFPNLLTN